MNEELQSTVNTALVSVMETAGTAKDFILSEVPVVVEELLRWHLAKSIVECVVALILLLVIYKYWKWLTTNWKRQLESETGAVPECMIGGAATVGFFIWSMTLLNIVWLQIWLAPKLYILEYATGLMK